MSDIVKVIKFLVLGDTTKAAAGMKGLGKEFQETAKKGTGFKGLGKNLREAVKSGQGWKGVKGVLKDASTEAGGLKGVVGKVGVGIAAVGAAAIAAGAAIAIKFGADSIATFKKVAGEVLGLKRVTGMTAEDASRLGFSLKQSGVDAAVGQKSFILFGKNLAGAASNAKKMKAMTDLLGFGFTDAAGKVLPMSKLLPKVADRFAKMPDGAEKSALAMKLFGKSGVAMIPFLNKGAKGLDELAKKSDKFGNTLTDKQLQALKDSKQAQRDWDAAMQGLQVTLGANLLPLLTQGANMLNSVMVPALQSTSEWVHKNEAASTAFGNIIKWVWNNVLLPMVKLAIVGFVRMNQPLGMAVEALGKLTGNKDLENFGAGLVKAGDDAINFANNLKGIPDEVAPKVNVDDKASKKVADIKARIKTLRGKIVKAEAKGDAREVDKLRNKIRALTGKTVKVYVKIIGKAVRIGAVAGGKLGVLDNARGGLVRAYAGGGIESHAPKLYRRHDGMRVFNEDETKGEAYIPLANDWRRPRALAVWRQTGRELGVFAGGGMRGGRGAKAGTTIYAPITVQGAITADAGRQIVSYLQELQRATNNRPLAIKTQR